MPSSQPHVCRFLGLVLSLPLQVTTIPFDLIILQMAGLQQSDSVTAW
jgi:hypothetical protein